MIFYFSATGNSKHVACQLANATGDKAVNILDYSLDQPISLMDEKMVGIITPVYCGGVPYPVADFLKKAKLIQASMGYENFFSALKKAEPLESSFTKRKTPRAKATHRSII